MEIMYTNELITVRGLNAIFGFIYQLLMAESKCWYPTGSNIIWRNNFPSHNTLYDTVSLCLDTGQSFPQTTNRRVDLHVWTDDTILNMRQSITDSTLRIHYARYKKTSNLS